MPSAFKKSSLLIPAVIIAVVSIEPAIHHWLDGYETERAIATGLHTADSAIYLWAVYIFLRTIISQYARTAFILFTASGSVGGILYLFGLLFG
ncbi:MAG: hypothetical protein VCC01_02810, partial [Candidatus Hydrogenedentota bacterium]